MSDSVRIRGKFAPGKSGNPGGRPKGSGPNAHIEWKKFKAYARDNAEEAARILMGLARHASKDSDRIKACTEVIAYAWGKPGTAEIPAEEAVNLDTASPTERIRVFELAIAKERQRLEELERAGGLQ